MRRRSRTSRRRRSQQQYARTRPRCSLNCDPSASPLPTSILTFRRKCPWRASAFLICSSRLRLGGQLSPGGSPSSHRALLGTHDQSASHAERLRAGPSRLSCCAKPRSKLFAAVSSPRPSSATSRKRFSHLEVLLHDAAVAIRHSSPFSRPNLTGASLAQVVARVWRAAPGQVPRIGFPQPGGTRADGEARDEAALRSRYVGVG